MTSRGRSYLPADLAAHGLGRWTGRNWREKPNYEILSPSLLVSAALPDADGSAVGRLRQRAAGRAAPTDHPTQPAEGPAYRGDDRFHLRPIYGPVYRKRPKGILQRLCRHGPGGSAGQNSGLSHGRTHGSGAVPGKPGDHLPGPGPHPGRLRLRLSQERKGRAAAGPDGPVSHPNPAGRHPGADRGDLVRRRREPKDRGGLARIGPPPTAHWSLRPKAAAPPLLT